jgi:hypothetical protein
MKGVILTAVAVLAVSFGAYAQDDAVATAVSAAPANLREGATVVKWNTSDFTYTTLKKGTNQIVCYDRSGFPEQQAFSIECTALGNLDRVAQNLKAEALNDKAKTAAMLDQEEKDGTRVKPVFGSVWYHLMGPDKDHPRVHMTIAVPGATATSMGLPDNPKGGGVWIMNAGTSTAHLMTPGE